MSVFFSFFCLRHLTIRRRCCSRRNCSRMADSYSSVDEDAFFFCLAPPLVNGGACWTADGLETAETIEQGMNVVE
ncbi:hypothetical protein P3T76_005660 [Phytophthora citrophthora]|uniref:Uncharacterized protein n=1 Tax=Phytophthora citrophthora TaxID=4793 RepID=A0AAD9GRQ7_9STRA|nr:hypothetical protein P3T76_005660 [Phytophthora citrophthora]